MLEINYLEILWLSIYISMFTSYFFKKKNIKILYNCFFLVFLILSVLRWERGADWGNYINLFYMHYEGFEKGYTNLNIIMYNFYESYTLFLFFQGIIIYICTKKFFENTIEKKDLMVALFIYYSLYIGNIFFVRQSVALAIFVYSLGEYNKNNKKRFYILNLISSYFFHFSAMIFLIVPLVLKIKNNKKNRYFMFLGLIFAPLYQKIILEMMLLLGKYIPRISEKLNVYLNMNEEFSYLSYINKYVILIIIFLGYRNDKSNKNNSWINLYIIGNIILISLMNISTSLSRIGNYFLFLEVVLITNLCQKFKKIEYKIFYFVFLGIYYFFRFILNVNRYYDLFIPYKTIFNKGLQVIIG